VTGNNAVHQLILIDVDYYNTAISLFGLVNLVVEDMITSPRRSKDSMTVYHRTLKMVLTKEMVIKNNNSHHFYHI
jgi:hypothetical protein